MDEELQGRSICTAVEHTVSSWQSPLVCLRDLSLDPCCLFCMSVICLHQYRALLLSAPCLRTTVFIITPAALLMLPPAPPSHVASLRITPPVFSPEPMNGTLCSMPKKSSHMVIGHSSLQSYSPSSTLHGEPVPFVTTTRHLGLIISSTLKWSAHVESILSRVSWKVALLKHLLFRCHLPLPVFFFFIHCSSSALS